MNGLISLLLLSQTYQVVGGEVAYWTRVKSGFGLIAHTVTAVNRDVTGEVTLQKGRVQGTLYIPVVRFRSSNSQRDKDVAEILEYQKYPYILAQVLASLDTLAPPETIEATITLRVKEEDHSFQVPVWIEQRQDTVVAGVEFSTRYTEVGLEPPYVKGIGFLGRAVSQAQDTLVLKGTLKFKEVVP